MKIWDWRKRLKDNSKAETGSLIIILFFYIFSPYRAVENNTDNLKSPSLATGATLTQKLITHETNYSVTS